MKNILMTVVAIALAALMASAQFSPAGQTQQPAQPQAAPQAPARKQPQVKSKDELESIKKLQDPSLTPDQRIVQAEEFLVKYPDSELKTFVYRIEMQSYQQKGDSVNIVDVGEKLLKEEPNDAWTLITLASEIPVRTRENDLDKDQKLKKAEDYANRAIAAVDKLEKPNPQITDADFDRAKNDARSQLYTAMGVISTLRKQYSVAEEQYNKALTYQTPKDPVTLYRLGQAYLQDKKYKEARDTFKAAMDAGGVKMGGRDIAAEDYQRVDNFLKQQQGGATPAQQPAPAQPPAAPAVPKP